MAPLQRSAAVRQSIRRFRKSFRDGATTAANAIRQEAQTNIQRMRHVPRWMRVLSKVYHEYGLKHALLITVLIIYQFIGAAIFYLCEAAYDESREMSWKENVKQNRTRLIHIIISSMFNNSEYLFFLTADQTAQVERRLDQELSSYEKQLGIKHTDQKIRWDFWNAMLYAQTVCTTIGYGHLYPSTAVGRLFTMLYAIVGIPLVLSILDDLGKLLTKCLKTPWYLIKCGCRRLFRYCTKQTMAEIRKLDAEDKRDLEIFDLPIPIAIIIVIAWIFICSATFCIWEKDWDYFVAFYFFFISLSTIGLGDITPTEPKYLLMLFIYIIIGLSLVSMCINLIQSQMARTYEVGQLDNLSLSSDLPYGNVDRIRRTSLGVFKSRAGSGGGSAPGTGDSARLLTRDAVQASLLNRKKSNKSSQTMLSFPSPRRNSSIYRHAYNSRVKFLPRNLSIDDVMKLVDTEEGDIIVLTELIRDDSNLSDVSDNSDGNNQIVVSKSFDSNFVPCNYPRTPCLLPNSPSTSLIKSTFSNRINPSATYITPSMHDIEAIEEIEDRILLGRATDMASSPAVHFRSRLSLIPERHSVIDEGDEQEYADEDEQEDGEEDDDDDDDTRPLETSFTTGRENSPERSRSSPGDSRSITTLISTLISGRESKRRQSKDNSGTADE